VANKLFIGVGHKARQGKDSVCSAIHNTFPSTTRVMGFADAVKSHCRVVHQMSTKDAPLLQRVGTDMRESHGENIWVRTLLAAAEDASENIVLINDLRFPNEAEAIKARGGILIKVERHTNSGLFVASDRDPNHPSETALDDWLEWDFVVENIENRQHQLRESALEIFAQVVGAWIKRGEQHGV
jgi:hypothetical protein